MSNETYADKLASYLNEHSSSTKNDLLLKVTLALFRPDSASAPERLVAFEEARRVLATLHPDQHQPYNRAALTTSLGECVVEWFGEALGRPLTGRDLDRLFDDLPDSGVREVLKTLATVKSDER